MTRKAFTINIPSEEHVKQIDYFGMVSGKNTDKFAATVCSELDASRASGSFKKLYVVAAPGFLGLLRKHQSGALKQTVAGEVDKNLSTRDPASIRKHLPDFL